MKETIHMHRVMRLRTHKEYFSTRISLQNMVYVCIYVFIYGVFNSRVSNSDHMVSKVKITVKINCKFILMESVVAYFQELSKHLPEGMKYSVMSVGVLVDIQIRQSENNIQKHYSLN